jgi:hypothetical protein
MPNVENNAEEAETVVEEELNPLNRFKYTEDELAAYLKENAIPGEDPNTRPKITDYVKDVDKPAVKNYKTMFFSLKNAGKTRILRTMTQLNRRNPLCKTKRHNHLRWLLENGHVDEIDWVEGLDSEGKGDVNKDKFDFAHFRNRSMFYENGPMPAMQNPVAYIREFVMFLKATKWAYLHPDLYKQKTGLDAPTAVTFENLSILSNQIMDYVRTLAHEDKIEKLEKKGQELGAPLIKKFDNWDLRNRNWDFFSGFIQNAFPLTFASTARSKFKWVDSEPTDAEEAATYNAANYAYNIVVLLYRVDNESTRKRQFFAQIISSDFMEPGTMYPTIENPDYFKIISEIVKYSHRKILDKNGKWTTANVKNAKGEVTEKIEVWVENDKAPATTLKHPEREPQADLATNPPSVAATGGSGKVESAPMPSVNAIKAVIAKVNMETASAKPASPNGNRPSAVSPPSEAQPDLRSNPGKDAVMPKKKQKPQAEVKKE